MQVNLTSHEIEMLKDLVRNSLERLRIRLDAADVDFSPELNQREERLRSLINRLSIRASQPLEESYQIGL